MTACARWRVAVGLEVHVQLSSQSKLFSRAAAVSSAAIQAHNTSPPSSSARVVGTVGSSQEALLADAWREQASLAPNVRVAPFDAALPGTLPRLNLECVRRGVKLGLAVGGSVQQRSVFERKHYFYPDQPHNYQITQQSFPLVVGGIVRIRTRTTGRKNPSMHESVQEVSPLKECETASAVERDVRLIRIQLETDTGKSTHEVGRSLIDLNRAGVGLLEIVTEPDMTSAEEAAAFVRAVQHLVRHLNVSTANIDEGELRCDVNVSLHSLVDPTINGDRCEIKNINGPRYVAKAIEFEVARQKELLEAGHSVAYETRAFDAPSGTTVPLRSKEQEIDYRFMPEPDLPPLILSPEFVAECEGELGELPERLRTRLLKVYALSEMQADVLLDTATANYFEKIVRAYGAGASETELGARSRSVADLLANQLFGLMHERGEDPRTTLFVPSSTDLAELLSLRAHGQLSSAGVRMVLRSLYESLFEEKSHRVSVLSIAKELRILQENDLDALERWCETAIAVLPDVATAYQRGEKRALRRLVGDIMKRSGGRANPAEASRILETLLQQAENRS